MVPIVGFLPADDPRVLATIDATEERLTDGRGLVYRYRADDGLEGEEGTFLLCTFWLAQALALAGRTERARAVFERAAAFVNDVGLLAEEVDAASGELLGNFPQAFSHIGLVNAAWAISQAESCCVVVDVSRPGLSLFQPWNGARSPASQRSRSPGVLRSQSGRISRAHRAQVPARSSTDGRPQNQ